MINLPPPAVGPAFHGDAVLSGVPFTEADCDGLGRLRVEVDGSPDCLRFYGDIGTSRLNPVVFLEGDVVTRDGDGVGWRVIDIYTQLSPDLLQSEAAQYAAASTRTFINLARPGVFGSTGHHLQRRREREVALVDRALDRLKEQFGWNRIDLAGQSGGGHLVAALLGRRTDIDHAVIASGAVAVRERLRERGLTFDVTGYADFVDPIDLVPLVASHPPAKVVLLTDPQDRVNPATTQTAYFEALRRHGINAEQRWVMAVGPDHHRLRLAAIIAALACRAGE